LAAPPLAIFTKYLAVEYLDHFQQLGPQGSEFNDQRRIAPPSSPQEVVE
jgi:hypothetical protein